MRTTLVLALAVLGCGCRSGAKPDPQVANEVTEEPMKTDENAVHLEARVSMPGPGDPKHPGKKFSGVFLEATDGTVWVATYRSDPLWTPFRGERVIVDGVRYTPKGQALSGPHIDVHTWRLADEKSMARYVSVGAIEELTGSFRVSVGEVGTKEEGERKTSFSTGGTGYSVLNPPGASGSPDAVVTIRARKVELSPFSAHGGTAQWLWIVE